ncbi:MAG: hypothetical protein AB1564_08490 [Chloroflexota bacterium]
MKTTGKQKHPSRDSQPFLRHRFLDEAGDMAFFGKGTAPIIGIYPGVSLSFTVGMVKFNSPLEPIREEIRRLQDSIANDRYLKDIVSIQKKKAQPGGYYFHATDDTHETRKVFFEFINSLDLTFEAAVGRKIPSLFARKHNSREAEFYADMLSHLLKNKLQEGDDLILNIARRGATTRNSVLQLGLDKATIRFLKRRPEKPLKTRVVFNVQSPRAEPLLAVPDYLCWAVQRVFERGETRYYNFVIGKISRVMDLYDPSRYKNNRNYYTEKNPLTPENKISPPSY